MRDCSIPICIPTSLGDAQLERLAATLFPEHTDFFDRTRPCHSILKFFVLEILPS